ncbi:unnamed protein product, partial [Meganyctiphanes norvegica]
GQQAWAALQCSMEKDGYFTKSQGLNVDQYAQFVANFTGWDGIPEVADQLIGVIKNCSVSFEGNSRDQLIKFSQCLKPPYLELCGLKSELTLFFFPDLLNKLPDTVVGVLLGDDNEDNDEDDDDDIDGIGDLDSDGIPVDIDFLDIVLVKGQFLSPGNGGGRRNKFSSTPQNKEQGSIAKLGPRRPASSDITDDSYDDYYYDTDEYYDDQDDYYEDDNYNDGQLLSPGNVGGRRNMF